MRKTNEFENDTLKAECIEKKFEFFRDDAENIENNANISRIYIYMLKIFRKKHGVKNCVTTIITILKLESGINPMSG
jgi:hypothetical protein